MPCLSNPGSSYFATPTAPPREDQPTGRAGLPWLRALPAPARGRPARNSGNPKHTRTE